MPSGPVGNDLKRPHIKHAVCTVPSLDAKQPWETPVEYTKLVGILDTEPELDEDGRN